MKNPYTVIVKRLVTEKAKLMENLQNKANNPSIARCKAPKYVFVVDVHANKSEVAQAVEEIYRDQGVKVVKVNTLKTKGKMKRRGRFRPGYTSVVKKAIVTLEEGNTI